MGYRIAAVLGSGGHTSEIFRILSRISRKADIFIIGEDDFVGLRLAEEYSPTAEYMKIRRPRQVGQPYFLSIFTSIIFIMQFMKVLLKSKPIDLVICNGPAITVIVAICLYGQSLVKRKI